jgi:Flp pilus assembly pilin Flp
MTNPSSGIAAIVEKAPQMVPVALLLAALIALVLVGTVHRLVTTKYHVRVRWKGVIVDLEPQPPATPPKEISGH